LEKPWICICEAKPIILLLIEALKPMTTAIEIIISDNPRALLMYDIFTAGLEKLSDDLDEILFAMKYSRFNFLSFLQN
jgi:hypothetical protein